MADKPEPRVDVNLPVRVFGMDADGRPFSQKVHAINISYHGAKLAGLEQRVKPGDVIGVQLRDKKARCKVIWVVDGGQAQKIKVGVKMVEGQPCPWQDEMEAPPDVTPPAQAAAAKEDKRKFTRQRVAFPLEIRDAEGVGTHMRTQTADMNGTGCYVETMLPLPVGKTLSISIWLESEKINTTAIVRTCDGGVGMGIEFTGLDEQTQNRLQQQVEAMAAESEPSEKTQGAG
jgi:hypothetical protein